MTRRPIRWHAQLVIGEIGPSAATSLHVVKLLAAYLSGNGDAGNMVGSKFLQYTFLFSIRFITTCLQIKLCIT
jgi:hypothetical protein